MEKVAERKGEAKGSGFIDTQGGSRWEGWGEEGEEWGGGALSESPHVRVSPQHESLRMFWVNVTDTRASHLDQYSSSSCFCCYIDFLFQMIFRKWLSLNGVSG